MSTGRVRSKTGCLTCKNRRKKCDETRPVCERCTKAGMECLGYSYLDERDDKSKRSPPKAISRPAKSTSAIAGPSRQLKASTLPPSTPSSHPSTPISQSDQPPRHMPPAPTGGLWRGLAPHFPGDPAPHSAAPDEPLDFSFLSDNGLNLYNPQSQSVTSGWWDMSGTISPSGQQPNEPTNSIPGPSHTQQYPDPVLRSPEAITGHLGSVSSLSACSSNTRSMTAGQASLFQALFSLGEANEPASFPHTPYHTPPSSHGSTWPSPDTEDGDSATSEESDPEGVTEIVCSTPKLDRNTPSNTLPFVLHSYSRWMTRMLFEPLKMATKARDWLTIRFHRSEDSRWTLTLMANVMQSLSKSSAMAADVLPAISILRTRAQHTIALATNSQALVTHEPREAIDALDAVFEVLSVQFLSSSLASNLSLIREAVPVYQRASPEPLGAPIDLPSRLVHPDLAIRHFPALDIIISTALVLPMQFRYETYCIPELYAGFRDSDDAGLQWLHGIPDQYLLLLAEMNMLRVDFAPHVDAQIVAGIERKIKDFRPVISASSDPYLSVVRLAVQEAWRQALYIYLYMGLSGADARDNRVEKAQRGFIRLLEGTKPGRTPVAFMMLPMIVSGVASQRPQDRQLIRNRMSTLRECQQPGSCGFETILALDELWARVDSECRPAVWMDLRCAFTVISGIV